MSWLARILGTLTKFAPIRLWALIGAGPPLTIAAGALVWIVWNGGWPPALADKQLQILGISLYGVLLLIAVIMVALAAVRLSGKGPGGISLNIDSDHEDPANVRVTTQEGTTISAPEMKIQPPGEKQ